MFLGCESKKSVDYYRANLSEAKERVAQCKGIKNKSKKTAKGRIATDRARSTFGLPNLDEPIQKGLFDE